MKVDWNHYPGIGREVLAIHKFYVYILYMFIFIYEKIYPTDIYIYIYIDIKIKNILQDIYEYYI